MRDEVLNGEEFDKPARSPSRDQPNGWSTYNTLRPHRGLGMLTPPRSPQDATRDLK